MRSKTDFVEKNAARQVETHMETNIVAQTLTACMKKKKNPRHVCINLAGLISSIWTWRLMHLLRLLAAMSSAAAGWARPIIS